MSELNNISHYKRPKNHIPIHKGSVEEIAHFNRSRQRTTDLKKYREGYDLINWDNK